MDMNTVAPMIYALFAAMALPYLLSVLARMLGKFDISEHNAQPRIFLQQLTGAASRAHAAEKNSYETLIFFYASVLTAQLMVIPQSSINQLAWLYVLFRIGYAIAYLYNAPSLRSSFWLLSMSCPCLLLWLCLQV